MTFKCVELLVGTMDWKKKIGKIYRNTPKKRKGEKKGRTEVPYTYLDIAILDIIHSATGSPTVLYRPVVFVAMSIMLILKIIILKSTWILLRQNIFRKTVFGETQHYASAVALILNLKLFFLSLRVFWLLTTFRSICPPAFFRCLSNSEWDQLLEHREENKSLYPDCALVIRGLLTLSYWNRYHNHSVWRVRQLARLNTFL